MKTIFAVLILTLPFVCYSETSADNRNGKTVELTVQAGVDYRMSPTQLSAMYFFTADDLLGLKVGADRTSEERQTSVAVQYKHYFENTFYLAAEMFYLNTREDVNGVWGTIFNQQDYADYTSLGAGVRIGNQWTWKHVTLGCDWIGYGRRIGTFQKDTPKLNTNTFTLLNVIVGVSF
jgi:hypothetical protein